MLTYCRLLYFVLVLPQWYSEKVGYLRPLLYFGSTLLNLVAIWSVNWIPGIEKYFGAICILSFSTFTFNKIEVYTSLDHMALIIGFMACSYISSVLISKCWKITLFGQFIATCLVFRFYMTSMLSATEFQFKSLPSFVMVIASICWCSYQTQNKEKYLNMYYSAMESQIKSLKVVFDSIPEGVVITNSKKNSVLLMNQQAK